ncbi:MAG: hypothetical protein QMB70_01345, partial [Aeromonadaceae bacterium]
SDPLVPNQMRYRTALITDDVASVPTTGANTTDLPMERQTIFPPILSVAYFLFYAIFLLWPG